MERRATRELPSPPFTATWPLSEERVSLHAPCQMQCLLFSFQNSVSYLFPFTIPSNSSSAIAFSSSMTGKPCGDWVFRHQSTTVFFLSWFAGDVGPIDGGARFSVQGRRQLVGHGEQVGRLAGSNIPRPRRSLRTRRRCCSCKPYCICCQSPIVYS